MAPNSSMMIQKSPLFHFTRFPLKPFSPFSSPNRISANSNQKIGSRVCFSCQSYSPSSDSSHGIGFGVLGSYKMRFRQMGFNSFRIQPVSDGGFGVLGSYNMRFRQMGFDSFRVQAVSDGGSGGIGGFGGSGDGNSGGGGEGESGGKIPSLLSWYLIALEKYPVFTKALTSAFLTLIGDLICQLWIDRVLTLDLKRTFVFTLLGFVLVGPTLHFWYFYLSRLVTVSGAKGAFIRLLIDQCIFSPIFIGVFLSALVTLEGRPSLVVPKLQQEWFSSVLANWQLWIPFQFLNFRFVPQQFQVLAANFVALAWNVILSFKAHKDVLPK
ncbi:peroxisomal membrane 22 kDa (Mpv17/PMP22) family protein [Tasmannia lanceolata]|uniref:peroxisomal membrane 22 kDa (Mpv17/PMP22) family protein n=1 Tax=Tasmannia lanceolata TaxID=3420 RepID=UPI004062B49E